MMARMNDQSNSQSDTSGLKRQSMVSAAMLAELIGPWADGADPLNEQLAAALARAIDLGLLPPGTRLPAERELARELALSRTTIVAAYDRLRLAGLARSRQGSGTRVAARRPGLTQAYLAPLDGMDTDAVRVPATGGTLTTATAPAVGLLTPLVDDAIELTIGALPAGSIVAEAMAAAVRDDLPGLLLDSGYDPFGLPALRGQIAVHLTRLGVATDPDQVLVTSGAQQALHLIGSQLGGPGNAVVMENPSYIGAIDAFRTTGNRLIPIPVDEDGARVEVIGLLGSSAPVRLVYVIPTFQNPTAVVMPEARRRELARLASASGFQVVEDLTPDLTLGVDSPPPIAAFDPDDRVITVGSLSKLAWGGLRVGWVRASRPVIDRLVAGKIVADHSSSLVTQAIGARVFERLDDVAARSRKAGAERRAVLMEALATRLPDWIWTEPKGGLSLWVRLPGTDAVAFSRLAATLGVVVRPGPLASPDGGFRDHIRIAYGSEPDRLVDGVERLAAAWAAYTPATRSARPSLAVSV
jgi:DNA-binding transcriptional MocR family regulator